MNEQLVSSYLQVFSSKSFRISHKIYTNLKLIPSENVYFRSVSFYECEKKNEMVNTNLRPNAEDRGFAGWLRPRNTVAAGERDRRPGWDWQPKGAGVSHIIEIV